MLAFFECVAGGIVESSLQVLGADFRVVQMISIATSCLFSLKDIDGNSGRVA